MANFFTPYDNRPPRKGIPGGTRLIDEHGEVLDEDGRIVIGKIGKIDQYSLVQAARGKDIYEMLRDSGVDPDKVTSSKAAIDGLVNDFVGAPRSFLEAAHLIQKAKDSFNALPLEVRDEFSNDPYEMLLSLNDQSFEKRMSKFIVMPESPASEVKDGN